MKRGREGIGCRWAEIIISGLEQQKSTSQGVLFLLPFPVFLHTEKIYIKVLSEKSCLQKTRTPKAL